MNPQTDLKLSRVGFLMLTVSDMARSLAFYEDTLGLPRRFASEEFAFLDGGGVGLGLCKVGSLGPPPTDVFTEIVFEVEDIDAAYESLRARGVTFRIAPRQATGDKLVADFRDPDGHVLSIFGPKRA
jgi:catechol 2,3-dioxygenase-like lactoylglutathione lyase family enzyme